jgi:iron complex transport system substrate-binding protein
MLVCVRRSDRLGATFVALISAGFLLAVPARGETSAPVAPTRVVSMNLCTDQLALALADPAQIVSLSHFATDPNMSVRWKQAEEYPLNYGRAEEISFLHPDLVLADTWSNPDTIAMLKTLGMRVEQLPSGTSLPEIRARWPRSAPIVVMRARRNCWQSSTRIWPGSSGPSRGCVQR